MFILSPWKLRQLQTYSLDWEQQILIFNAITTAWTIIDEVKAIYTDYIVFNYL
jgi:hypothetical protein